MLAILPYDNEDEAIGIANDTVYGLAGHVQSADQDARRVAPQIRAGQVHINYPAWAGRALRRLQESGNGREYGEFGSRSTSRSRRSSATEPQSFLPARRRADTRVLVLGSLPGERSLAEGRYYAHPRNLFWRLIGEVIGRELEALGYDARLEALLGAGIGLWDTVASATRAGSLDAAIREAEHNPLVDLAETLPELRAVAFNGAKSAKIGMAALAGSELALMPLPSSSPANASLPYAEKLRLWRGDRRIPRLTPCLLPRPTPMKRA